LYRYAAKAGQIGKRKFKTTLPEHHIRFYKGNPQRKDGRRTTRVKIEHNGIKYFLRYVKGINKVPYSGDVVNLSVEGSPTFQTAVGMSHNTVKPMKIMEGLLQDMPKDQGPILDPFLGSGTTGIACLKTGHDFIGIEKEKEYAETAVLRVKHWDRELKPFGGAEITSNVVIEEKEETELSLEDLFGV